MKRILLPLLTLAALLLVSCDTVDNKTIPSYSVRINLGTYALWNTYGVSGVGDYRIFNRAKQLPANFPYNANTFTGYGGVLLIMALDPATSSYAPQAFDAACPVERDPGITLSISPDNLEAICPKCGSHFNVVTGSGSPTAGQAMVTKVGLTQYRVTQTTNGGYVITNR